MKADATAMACTVGSWNANMVGEVVVITCKTEYAYGSIGSPPDIPTLFPNLDKVVYLEDDIVIQRDLSPVWYIDLSGKVNGAVETCKGEDEWVMSKQFRNYFNFSLPLIAKNLNPKNYAWAYGMNIFDLRA